MIKYENFTNKSLNICFLELLVEFRRDSTTEFESAIVNDPPVFGIRAIEVQLCNCVCGLLILCLAFLRLTEN